MNLKKKVIFKKWMLFESSQQIPCCLTVINGSVNIKILTGVIFFSIRLVYQI